MSDKVYGLNNLPPADALVPWYRRPLWWFKTTLVVGGLAGIGWMFLQR